MLDSSFKTPKVAEKKINMSKSDGRSDGASSTGFTLVNTKMVDAILNQRIGEIVMKTTRHKAYNIIRVLETLRTISDDASCFDNTHV